MLSCNNGKGGKTVCSCGSVSQHQERVGHKVRPVASRVRSLKLANDVLEHAYDPFHLTIGFGVTNGDGQVTYSMLGEQG